MNFRRYVYQLLGIRDDSVVPAVCYATCNNVYIATQKIGKTPALCAADSSFMTDYAYCESCIIANANTTSVSLTGYTDPELSQFVDFCNDQSNSSVVSSQVGVLSMAATVQAALSSKASEGSVSISTQISTLISVSILTVEASSAAPTPNPTPSPNPTPAPSSKAWIAGAVIGPVLFIFVIAAALFFYRRRNRKRNETTTITYDTEKKEGDEHGKAQLHGDSVTMMRHELEGERSPELVWELPALEPVGTELQDRKHDQLEDSEPGHL